MCDLGVGNLVEDCGEASISFSNTLLKASTVTSRPVRLPRSFGPGSRNPTAAMWLISTGGTGLTGRIVTVEAFQSVFEKEIDGFAAIFHQISYAKRHIDRTIAGLCRGGGGTYLFALPGSPGAVKDGWDGILKGQLDIRHRPCNFVEIMPRLTEK